MRVFKALSSGNIFLVILHTRKKWGGGGGGLLSTVCSVLGGWERCKTDGSNNFSFFNPCTPLGKDQGDLGVVREEIIIF